jgi:hypothetical protein
MFTNITGFILLVIAWVSAYWFNMRADQGKVPHLRPIAALEAINEAVGRAVEMGRPIHWTSGHGGAGLYSERAGDHMAGLSILSYLAAKSIEQGADLRASLGFSELIPITEDIIYQRALAEGQPEFFNRDKIYFNTDNWVAYDLYTFATLQDIDTAANIIVGNVDTTTGAIISCGAHMAGAMNIIGSRRADAVAQSMMFSDYFLMGDELPAMGALLEGDEDNLSIVVSGDISKFLYIALIILGSILASIGISTNWVIR